jgi:hypothetical protein
MGVQRLSKSSLVYCSKTVLEVNAMKIEKTHNYNCRFGLMEIMSYAGATL